MDVGGGLVVSDASTGLAVDVRVRMLLMHQAEGFRERGMAVSVSCNPSPSTPLGLTARLARLWGGEATSGAEALWGRETMAGMAHGGVASGNRLDGEIGYGLPVGSRFVGTPRVGFSTSEHGRDYRLGYSLGVQDRESLNLVLGVDAQRRDATVRAVQAAVDGVDSSRRQEAAAAAWHAAPIVRFFCATLGDGIAGVGVSEDGFVVTTAELSGREPVEASIAVGSAGTCACRISAGATHLASTAPDVRSFEQMLKGPSGGSGGA